ncbi:ABC transporter ATP-binding protein [Thermoflavimicrobium dichotomicum]|uniref:ABC-type nitrate/sulfonate/bicarbonate transport system, ATPase component n=1 Tax=Thermoflavimicrobium dichotomicum TaxID=46223 RepID=A0A1I3P8J4_9BACL|nr:ABC transporter ATP-binding protein [Thermoflavimicrobium dichotomicum]SFJ17356.1 ABC-type nitrate/sulfonate/bicarbonate transport system, ATPase component [Thermoflavimicrobium dichotomicum]
MLYCEQLSFRYQTRQIIQHLTFHVNEGEFVSLIGPSGSGKSTLFYLIGGLYEPEEGTIYLEGERVNGKRGLIGYMPQTSSLFPWRTVEENIRLSQELEGQIDPKQIKQLLERIGLSSYANHFPHQLSGGMQQRVAFARTLASKKKLLCLDEPFGALDALTRSEMQRWLLSILEEEKRTVLFITHSVEEAILLSDRIYVLTPGPMKVKKEFHVPFPREHRWDQRGNKDFLELREEIEAMLLG